MVATDGIKRMPSQNSCWELLFRNLLKIFFSNVGRSDFYLLSTRLAITFEYTSHMFLLIFLRINWERGDSSASATFNVALIMYLSTFNIKVFAWSPWAGSFWATSIHLLNNTSNTVELTTCIRSLKHAIGNFVWGTSLFWVFAFSVCAFFYYQWNFGNSFLNVSWMFGEYLI